MVTSQQILKNLFLVGIALMVNTSALPMVEGESKRSQPIAQKKEDSRCYAERAVARLSNTKLWTTLCDGLGSWAVRNTTDATSDPKKPQMSFFIRDTSWEWNGEMPESIQKMSTWKKSMILGGLAVTFFVIPVVYSKQNYVKKSEFKHGSIKDTFEKLDRENDVCRSLKTAKKDYPGCCNVVKGNQIVCCRTDGKAEYCFTHHLDVLPRTKIFDFDTDGDPTHFDNGGYIQQGNIIFVQRLEEDDAEIPDDLFAYTLPGKNLVDDEALVLQVCQRKELSDRMKNALLHELRENYEIVDTN